MFLILSQFWLKFGQILKNRPILIPDFAFYKGHSYTKRLILLPILAAHPRRVFCTKYPRGQKSLPYGQMYYRVSKNVLYRVSEK